MGIQTFLGPILAGTQKNNNTVRVTSNTPSASYLSPYGTGDSYRNTGAGDCFQFTTVPETTLTGIAAASFPATVIPTYTVTNGSGTTNYPLVFPAGSYIDNIDFIVNKAITFSGSPTSLAVAVQLIGAPGSTYATAQTIATVNLIAATLPSIGIYATANSGSASTGATTQTAPIVYSASATPIAMIQNTGPTDAMLQLVLTFTGGTTPAISTGAIGFAFNYVVRNTDGSWYPQTPPVPYSAPIPAVY
jgi:hypothetical protein